MTMITDPTARRPDEKYNASLTSTLGLVFLVFLWLSNNVAFPMSSIAVSLSLVAHLPSTVSRMRTPARGGPAMAPRPRPKVMMLKPVGRDSRPTTSMRMDEVMVGRTWLKPQTMLKMMREVKEEQK